MALFQNHTLIGVATVNSDDQARLSFRNLNNTLLEYSFYKHLPCNCHRGMNEWINEWLIEWMNAWMMSKRMNVLKVNQEAEAIHLASY